jgi:hypothetical protein
VILQEIILRFKTLMIFLNLLLLFFLALVFALPMAILGKETGMVFIKGCWYLVPLVMALLVVIDCYFAINSRIYMLLEKEDWPALIQELEQRVFSKSRYSRRLVKLLAASYLVISDARSVTELERKLAIANRRLVHEFALIFGAARILCKDYEGAVEFFAARIRGTGGKTGIYGKNRDEWVRWYFGFSLLLARRFEESADCFIIIAREAQNPILTGLSAYFLEENLAGFLPRRKELREEAAMGKARILEKLKDRKAWDKELQTIRAEVYAVVLTAYIGKAADYLFRKR